MIDEANNVHCAALQCTLDQYFARGLHDVGLSETQLASILIVEEYRVSIANYSTEHEIVKHYLMLWSEIILRL